MPEDPIHEVGWLKVGTVDHVVGAVGVLEYPSAFVGSVVVDEVSETEYIPVVLHDVYQAPHILHGVIPLLEIISRVKEMIKA